MTISSFLATTARLAVVGAVLATSGIAQTTAAPEQSAETQVAGAPSITKAMYNEKKGALLIVGTGFDDQAIVRVNGVEVQGERKYSAGKRKLRIKIPASSLQLKADGENLIEIVQGTVSSGEITF